MRKAVGEFVKRYISSPLFLKSTSYIICILFFIAYSILSIVRHNYYESFGFDLGINDQVVWRYSMFQSPVVTIDPLPTKTKLAEHVEIVYALIALFIGYGAVEKCCYFCRLDLFAYRE